MERRARILAIGRARRESGYGRVLHSVLRAVRDRFDVMRWGTDYVGPGLVEDGVPLEPSPTRADRNGFARLPEVLARTRPELVFFCHDPSLYPLVAPALRAAARPPRVVFYCPVGFARSSRDDLAGLAPVDHVVAYTRFGRGALAGALGLRAIDVIPHGVDTGVFRRRDRRDARAALFPHRAAELRDAFLVLSANRNAPRKRLDLALEAFARFSRGRRDAYLYLHCGMRDVGFDLPAIARRLGIEDRLLTTHDAPSHPAVPDAHLATIYAACDVGLHTPTGEGWGLTAFEHAATGAVQVAPDHSAFAELWRDTGVLVPATPQRTDDDDPARPAGVVSVDAAAAALDGLYRDRARLAALSEAAAAYAALPRFDWNRIGRRWSAVFARALEPDTRVALRGGSRRPHTTQGEPTT